MLQAIRFNKNVRAHVSVLRHSLLFSKVYAPRDLDKFVLLCGANQFTEDTTALSARRKALLAFAQLQLPHAQFFVAEDMFKVLQKEGSKKNILDIENTISTFADKVIIVLESPSAFAELGAFAVHDLREKLIVINDQKFKDSQSFISLGPLRAIEEESGKDHVIYYKMKDDGISFTDSIGDTFAPLYSLLKNPLKGRASKVDISECDPADNFCKTSVMMLHDLVYVCGPITSGELVEVLKILFHHKKNFRVEEHLALLVAIGSLSQIGPNLFRSALGRTYFSYRFDLPNVMSIFRNLQQKYFPNRIYGYS